MTNFLNPYHFVPFGDTQVPASIPVKVIKRLRENEPTANDHEVAGQVRHDRAVEKTFSGRIVCKLTTEYHCVVGGKQDKSTHNTTPNVVHPFKWKDEPAIPLTSLRGLITSLAEAASGSAMRVLNNPAMSRRSDIQTGESRSAIGMIWQRDPKAPPKVLLLTFPHLWSVGVNPGLYSLPSGVRAIADLLSLPVYVDGYQRPGNPPHQLVPRPGSFLNVKNPTPFNSTNDDQWWILDNGNQGGASCYALDANTNLRIIQPHSYTANARGNPLGPQRLIAQKPIAGMPILRGPYTMAQLRPLITHTDDHVIGILRRLSEADPNGGFEIPNGKYRELLIPISKEQFTWNDDGSLVGFEPFDDAILTAEEPISRFEAMADAIWQGTDGKRPLLLHAQSMPGNKFKLRHGDLVHVRLAEQATTPTVHSIAISSIWREDCGQLYEYLTGALAELRPFHLDRQQITPAEAVFGWVGDVGYGKTEEEKAENKDKAKNTIVAMAGRVRFSMGRICPGQCTPPSNAPANHGNHFARPRLLPILGSPKPPCAEFYFKNVNGAPGKVPRNALKAGGNAAVQPRGRKMYWHHSRDPHPEPDAPAAQFNQAGARMRNKVTALKPGRVFYFHVDFDNLTEAELSLLCYALRPTENFRHLLGMGKPLGLGRVRIDPVLIGYIDRHDRYGVQSDLSASARYQHVVVTNGQNQSELPEQYACERTPASAAGNTTYKSVSALREGFSEMMNSSIRQALKLIGEPEHIGITPVHYPLMDGQNQDGQNQYEWFMANRNLNNHLKPIGDTSTVADLTLPRLQARNANNRPPR